MRSVLVAAALAMAMVVRACDVGERESVRPDRGDDGEQAEPVRARLRRAGRGV
jgi:hypothetical protein